MAIDKKLIDFTILYEIVETILFWIYILQINFEDLHNIL